MAQTLPVLVHEHFGDDFPEHLLIEQRVFAPRLEFVILGDGEGDAVLLAARLGRQAGDRFQRHLGNSFATKPLDARSPAKK